ncbi:hypothetical protein DAI22_10g084601 [Oryza sativa Japonica Group]|nr:hypothetical protein DAI22_10g084601 [Oryza sativa Japonica Group]
MGNLWFKPGKPTIPVPRHPSDLHSIHQPPVDDPPSFMNEPKPLLRAFNFLTKGVKSW